jgi:hypothetical protein
MANELIKRDSVMLSELAKEMEPDEQRRTLVKRANSAYGMLSSIPMKCKTSKCPFAEACPLQEMDSCEEGERCPLESDMIREMFIGYCTELEVNPDIDKVQAGLIKDLCSVEVQALRASKLMSYGDLLVRVVDAINQRTGDVIYKDIVNEACVWSERLISQKIRILDTLAATPLVRAKYLGGDTKRTLQEILNEMRAAAEKVMPHEVADDAVYDTEDWRES